MSLVDPNPPRLEDTLSFREFLTDQIDARRNSGDVELVGSPEQLGALYGALAKATAAFKPVKKTAEVKFHDKNGRLVNYFYAPLAALTEATREGLAANGLCVLQPFSLRKGDDGIGVGVITTMLCHESGARMVSRHEFTPQGDIKTLGGQTTYLGRYALCRLLMLDGIEDADAMEESVPHGAGKAQGTAKPAPVDRPRAAIPSRDSSATAPAARAPAKPAVPPEPKPFPQPSETPATATVDASALASEPLPEEPRVEREPAPSERLRAYGDADGFDGEEPSAPDLSGPRTKPQEEAMRALAIRLKMAGPILGQLATKLTDQPIAAIDRRGADMLIQLLSWRLKHPDAKPAQEDAVIEKLRSGKRLEQEG